MIRVGLAGGAGFGRVHRANLARLSELGRTRLVGIADPAGPPADLEPGVRHFPTLTELLSAEHPDVVIIATPIHTHAPLAEEAFRAGAHVYLEKPPVASMAEYDRLAAVAAETGLSCQIGFQALGSLALPRISALVAGGVIGEPQLITGLGVWSRDRAYFQRSPWSGRRRLDGHQVSDGVATNALAHAVAQALRIAGIDTLDQIHAVRTELYRANLDNESDDTTWIRVDRRDALPVSVALTLCGPGNDQPPVVSVIGSEGRLDLQYTVDVLTVDHDGSRQTDTFGRIDLTENLLDHLADGTPLISALAGHAPYMAVLEAIQASDPLPLTDGVDIQGVGPSARPVIKDVEHWARRAAEGGEGFFAAGTPWADPVALATWFPHR
ncbi:dehydrogenase [Microlunatus endophyticus]|uniref:Dehydrogenase n=1 Tax=Microlunatus endophyticus TaxID=1716077 RepID=A0A917S9L5_9ACTN|nr:Gfo/Idh/MocA family oxidoreductase [Microlunatus endophyticus]GGL63051.1 dehydrogenase [Microlunatus endophyticus]